MLWMDMNNFVYANEYGLSRHVAGRQFAAMRFDFDILEDPDSTALFYTAWGIERTYCTLQALVRPTPIAT